MRVRVIYEKRGGACFVPHVALATLFSRAARRAGIEISLTDGFSPHAKMSFGPELPAGVVALHEPVDLWIKEEIAEEEKSTRASAWTSSLNEQMPGGFRVRKCFFLPENAPSLGKDCRAAHYWIWTRNGNLTEKFLEHMKNHFGGDVLSAEDVNTEEYPGSRASIALAEPAKNGVGGWVRAGVATGLIAGWQDLCIVRTALGRWSGAKVEPLEEARAATHEHGKP